MSYVKDILLITTISLSLIEGYELKEGTRSVAVPKETLGETLGSFDIDLDANYRYYTINNSKLFPKSDKYKLGYQTYLGYILNGSFNYKNYFKFPFYYIGSMGDEKALNKVSGGFGNGAYQSLLGLGSLIKIGHNDLYLGYEREFFNTPIEFKEAIIYNDKTQTPNKYVLVEDSESYEIGLHRKFKHYNVSQNDLSLSLEHIKKNKFSFNDKSNIVDKIDVNLYGFHLDLNIENNTKRFLKTNLTKQDFHMGFGNTDGNTNTGYSDVFYVEYNTESKAYLNKYISIGLNQGYETIDRRGSWNSTFGGLASLFAGGGFSMMMNDSMSKKMNYNQHIREYDYLLPVYSYVVGKVIKKIFKQDKKALEAKDFIGVSFNLRYD